MELAGATPFLILEHSSDGTGFSLRIARKRKSVICLWNSSTRVSPLFCVRGGGRKGKEALSPSDFAFSGINYVFFIGPVPLSSIRANLDENIFVWTTLGFGGTIQRLREAKGMSLSDLARASGRGKPLVSRIEREAAPKGLTPNAADRLRRTPLHDKSTSAGSLPCCVLRRITYDHRTHQTLCRYGAQTPETQSSPGC